MVKTSLPVLVLKDLILFPYNEIRLELDKEQDKELISLAESYYNKHILIINQKDILEKNIDINDLPQIGVIGYINMKIDLPNKKTRIVIRGTKRVKLSNTLKEDNIYISEIEPITYEELDTLEEIAYARTLTKQIEYYIENNPHASNSLISSIRGITDINKLTDILAAYLQNNYDRQLEYLYEVNPTVRVTMLLEDISQELKIVKLENELEEKINNNIEQSQKEYILQEKLKAIKEELQITFDKDSEINEIKEKIKNLEAKENIKTRLYNELKRYEITPSTSPEIAIIRNYIDNLLNIPWTYKTKDNKDLKRALNELNKTHYGMVKVKERIIEHLALQKMTNQNYSPIICLVGPPGVGKTTLTRSIATAMNKNYTKISVGGINDEAEIIGHRRAYIGSSYGKIIGGMKKAGSINPVFVIDEIDKMTKDIKGDPASSLLEVLDKEQNHKFVDNYLEEEYDLSNVMFICTANYKEQIPLELYDRLEIIELSSYTIYEKLNICKKHIIPKSITSHGLENIQVIFSDAAILKIINDYTKESGVRELERLISSILRKIIKKIFTEKEHGPFFINENEVSIYLGKEKYKFNKTTQEDKVGVVNGLSYTPLGGDILPIEAITYKGTGKIITTGSLGEVFKESTQIALSYIKSNYEKLNIDYKKLENIDIHLHVPEGAIKKEGPSAGVAILTSLISALSNKKISGSIAMTGEITLRGDILPIGGLKEKVIGAKKAGIKKVFIPNDNQKDLEELEENIKEDLTFILVNNYNEILKELKL